MNATKKIASIVLLLFTCRIGYAQDWLNALQAPGPNDRILGTLTLAKQHQYTGCVDGCVWGTKESWYNELLLNARMQYPTKHVDIRQMIPNTDDGTNLPWKGPVRCVVIELSGNSSGNNSATSIESTLSKAMEKSLRNVREGSRIAIDNVNVSGKSKITRENLKDIVIDALLDNGYKVVAKDFLERLYAEQQSQQSGIYNDRTTVQENNFSAVGYYINVKVTENSLRVQVVNVSTGEYEGNSTINF